MPLEAWLRGPLEGLDPYLMPAGHALVQAREDLPAAVEGLTGERLWQRPGDAASVGFHLRHIAGAIDRLATYARGEMLSDDQRRQAAAEAQAAPEQEASVLVAAAIAAIDAALAQMRATPRETLLEPRKVGRGGAPSTVVGLLFHLAEHTARHAGQVITTAKVVRGR
jgi:uncharacterized damage-inducible protein DinB